MSDNALSHHGTHFSDANIKSAYVQGGAAGDLTLSGIATTDELISVWSLDVGATTPDVSDLTDEFSITAANTINNTGGTSTAGNIVAVFYRKGHPNS